MSKILTIETSSSVCSAALSEDNRLLAVYSAFSGNMHDRLLAEYVKRLISDFGLSVGSLDAVAVSEGPGSFTGLRIGASVAKGLCAFNSPPLIAIPTLKALVLKGIKESAGEKFDEIAVLSHSHKDFYYFSTFDSEATKKSNIQNLPAEEINLTIKENSLVIITGKSEFISTESKTLQLLITADDLIEIAFEKFKKGDFTDVEAFVPDYQQNFVVRQSGKS